VTAATATAIAARSDAPVAATPAVAGVGDGEATATVDCAMLGVRSTLREAAAVSEFVGEGTEVRDCVTDALEVGVMDAVPLGESP